MKKMKGLALALCMALVLAGCGTGDDADQNITSTSTTVTSTTVSEPDTSVSEKENNNEGENTETEPVENDTTDVVENGSDEIVLPTPSENEYQGDEGSAYPTLWGIGLSVDNTSDEYYSSDGTEKIAKLSSDLVYLADEEASNVTNAEIGIAEMDTELKNRTEQCYQMAKANADQAYADGSLWSAYEVSSRVQVQRADSEVVSCLNYLFYYMGGEHPGSEYYGYVIDTKTGEVLTIDKVVTDTSVLPKLIAYAIGEENFSADISLKNSIRNMYEWGDNTYQFTLDYDGINFYFGAGTIALYEAGDYIAHIPYSEISEYMNPDYLDVAESYSTPVYPNMPVYLDVDGDSETETIYIYTAKESIDSDLITITLGCENAYAEVEGSFSKYQAYVVYNTEGTFIYITLVDSTGYIYTEIYTVSETSLVKAGNLMDAD